MKKGNLHDTESELQNAAFNALGFDGKQGRRNLVITIIVASWMLSVWALYEKKVCEDGRRKDIERLTSKYESQINSLYEKIINGK